MVDRDLQHPIITNMERTGYPDGKEPQYPICPRCGNECDTLIFDINGEIACCDVCGDRRDAWEVPECFPGKE